MLAKQNDQSTIEQTPAVQTRRKSPFLTANVMLGFGLILLWLALLLRAPVYLPMQLASWLTFLALFITPGYLLGDMLVWRLRLDWLERMALAFPLGVAVMALPGLFVLLQHGTIVELTTGWIAVTTAVVIGWLLHLVLTRADAGR
ncbi:MAG: hypothetical protein HC802_06005 [Caldilineaceae bacterium]|nr:hypothetical protein [Caldilineaceae bacterium]